MANNRELSQLGSIIVVDDSSRNLGIGTTNPNAVVGAGNTIKLSVGILSTHQLFGDGSNITGLTPGQVGAIPDVVSDTTPQLGGTLDVNGNDITGTGNVNLSGVITATSFSGDGSNLTGITAGQVGAIGSLVGDTTPQLGGDLDVNGNDITGTGNVNLTGVITATSFSGNGASLTNVDADTLGGISSTSFLRSDVADTKTSGNLTFSDGVSARFGDGEDLVIWHNGAHSHIAHQGTGNLNITNSNNDADVRIESDDGSGGIANYFLADGSTGEAILYH